MIDVGVLDPGVETAHRPVAYHYLCYHYPWVLMIISIIMITVSINITMISIMIVYDCC